MTDHVMHSRGALLAEFLSGHLAQQSTVEVVVGNLRNEWVKAVIVAESRSCWEEEVAYFLISGCRTCPFASTTGTPGQICMRRVPA